MKFLGPAGQSWTVNVTQPYFAVLALYLRDRWGVAQTGPPVPPVEPPVHRRADDSGSGLGEEWNRWWAGLLAEVPQPPDPSGRSLPDTLPTGTELERALAESFPDARRWVSERKLEYAPPSDPDGPAPRIAEAFGRVHPGGSGRSTIMVLPIAGDDPLPLDDGLLILPVRLGTPQEASRLDAVAAEWGRMLAGGR